MLTLSAGKASLSCRVASPWLERPPPVAPLAHVRLERRALKRGYLSQPESRSRLVVHARIWDAGGTKADSNLTFPFSTGTLLCAGEALDGFSASTYTYLSLALSDDRASQVAMLRFEKTGIVLAALIPVPAEVRVAALLDGPTLLMRTREGRALLLAEGAAHDISLAGLPAPFDTAVLGALCAWRNSTAVQLVSATGDPPRCALVAFNVRGEARVLAELRSTRCATAGIIVTAPRQGIVLLALRDCSVHAVCVHTGRIKWSIASLPGEAPLRLAVCGRLAVLRCKSKRTDYYVDIEGAELDERRWLPIQEKLDDDNGSQSGSYGAFLVGYNDSIGVCEWETGTVKMVSEYAKENQNSMDIGEKTSTSNCKQLAGVRENLQKRLTEGVSRVLESLRVAEDKSRLANNSLSLLQHVLSDSLHLPKTAECPVQMHVIASRRSPFRRDDHDAMDIDQAKTPPSENCLEEDVVGFEDILRSVVLDQSVDESQQYLMLSAHGVLSKYAWVPGVEPRAPLRLRLDVEVQSSTPMLWNTAYTQADDSGLEVWLFARTPWHCIAASAGSGDDSLRAHVQVRLDDDRKQHLGVVTLRSPAALLQKKVLLQEKRAIAEMGEKAPPQWLPEEETMIAVGGSQNTQLFEPMACGVQTAVAQSSSAAKVIVCARTAVSMASYLSAIRMSIADSAHLRFLATSKKYVASLKQWMTALQDETEGVRCAAATRCAKGLDKSTVTELIHLQIALDEACGVAKETMLICK